MTTKTTQHTPGPWEAVDLDGGMIRPANPDEQYRSDGTMRIICDEADFDLWTANRHLLAAAPDLLAALHKARAFISGRGDNDLVQTRVIIDAAIARAEGA